MVSAKLGVVNQPVWAPPPQKKILYETLYIYIMYIIILKLPLPRLQAPQYCIIGVVRISWPSSIQCTMESCRINLQLSGLSEGYSKFTAAGLPPSSPQSKVSTSAKQSNSKSFPSKQKRCVLPLDTSSYSSSTYNCNYK